MSRTAPHLVKAMPQLVPLLPSMNRGQRILTRVGFQAGDVLRALAGTPRSVLPRPRRIGADEAVALAPTVRREGLHGGLLAYDGQLIDDSRLVVAVARTAPCTARPSSPGSAASAATGSSVRLTDELTGESFDLAARAVINATGVWAAEVDSSIKLRPSRGTHLVFDAASFGNPAAALTIPIPGETNRFVFAMPEQLGRVYLGLTDEEVARPDPRRAEPTAEEVAFLLDTVNTALQTALTSADVTGAYAGLRPLVDVADRRAGAERPGNKQGRTTTCPRDHAVLENDSGNVQCRRRQAHRVPADGPGRARPRRGRARAARRAVPDREPAAGRRPSPVRPLAGEPAGLADRPLRCRGARRHRRGALRPAGEPVAEGIDVTRAEFDSLSPTRVPLTSTTSWTAGPGSGWWLPTGSAQLPPPGSYSPSRAETVDSRVRW